ncbi:unnamed protein product [Paramecium primaurelia]|uniref:RING-type E3 ubiquitin transferase n=1 Tax=Paramecium primaurelia TaxID=5886 RepID=A0A8S1KWS0_PARPR|nr:unnamed protein product [Paramecium primaurelia]
MLPHNQIEQGNDVRTRRIKFLIFLSISAMIMYSVTYTEDSEVHHNSLNKCLNVSGDQDMLNYIQNSTNKPSTECYLYQFLSFFAERHFKGQLNRTYTHFHVYQYSQLKPDFNISVLFSNSPYLDDPQQQFQFYLNVVEYVKTFNTPLILKVKNNDTTGCQNELIMELKNITNNMNISFAEQLIMDVRVETQCQNFHQMFLGSVKDNTEEVESQVITYSFLNSVVCLCCMIYGLRILRALIEGMDNPEEYSMFSIGFVMVQDLYMCFLNFFQAMQSEYLFQYFITPSFLQFLLFSIFEMRILMIIWKSRVRNDQSFRNQMIKFYLILYVCMFGSMYLIYEYVLSSWLLFFLSLYIVPQIIHAAQRGQIVRFNFKLICGFLLPRLIYYAYFRFYWNNLFSLKPMPISLICIVVSIGIQIGVHILQNEWGPQFFVPKICFPQKYNYYYRIPTSFDLEEGPSSEYAHLFNEECSICMGVLHQVPAIRLTNQEERNYMIKEAMKKQKNHYMKTPCDHKFHVLCLVKWMSIKLSCPSCRQSLSPL